jgi:hypothetical protein
LAYYSAFNWIGEIEISDADPETSRARALRKIEVAVDFLHVFIGARHSAGFRVGGYNIQTDRRGRFEIRGGAICEVEYSYHWNSPQLGRDWWSALNQRLGPDLFVILDTVIAAGLDTATTTPLAQRLIDAAKWYGDASREEFPASQIVKFITAMERILTTEKNPHLYQAFCDRGSALISYPEPEKAEEVRKRLGRVYSVRSNFVHGSRSPTDGRYAAFYRDAAELSRELILVAMLIFSKNNNIPDRVFSSKRLGKSYDAIVSEIYGELIR